MFYRPGTDDHGLPHNPFKAIVSPRPIAWISTHDAEGRANLAPYSFFNAFADTPPIVAYGTATRKIGMDEGKDSLANIRATGEFVVNLVAASLQQAMNISSQHFPHGVDEFEQAGVTKGAGQSVSVPHVVESPASLECKLLQVIDLPGANHMVIGEVTGIHCREEVIRDGRFDVTAYQPMARLGYRDYARVERVFELARPDD